MNSRNAALPMRSKRCASPFIRSSQLPRRSSISQPKTSGTFGHFAMLRETISSIARAILHSENMAQEDFKCVHRLRVRWAEVDMQKVVFNAHYLTYIDTTIAEHWGALGVEYPDGYVKKYANDIFLRKATVEYLGS